MTERDSLDLDQLEDTIRSAGFARLDERYRSMHAAKLRELARERDAIQSAEARGFLAGVEAVRRVPAILKREYTSAKRKPRG